MDACPICRAKLNGATSCRRCRADLRKVQEVEQRSQALVVVALQTLIAGDAAGAAAWIERAHTLHASPTVKALQALMDTALCADDSAR